MNYDVLKERVLHAQKLEEIRKLSGVQSITVRYIYAELLDGIEHQRFFMPRKLTTAQATLFTIKVESTQIFINTHYRYNAQHIKCFKCERKSDVKDLVEVIRSAVSQVGLKFVSHKFEKDELQIFIELERSTI